MVHSMNVGCRQVHIPHFLVFPVVSHSVLYSLRILKVQSHRTKKLRYKGIHILLTSSKGTPDKLDKSMWKVEYDYSIREDCFASNESILFSMNFYNHHRRITEWNCKYFNSFSQKLGLKALQHIYDDLEYVLWRSACRMISSSEPIQKIVI